MKQDEILQTLREVIAEAENFTTWTVSTPHLVELVKRAVEAEREACAKVCDSYYESWINIHGRYEFMGEGAQECATAIRARGNT
jgi:hypothetical protein